MNIDERESITQRTEKQLQPSARVRLVELAQAKLQLRRYRAEVIGTGKAKAVTRLLDGIQWLEAAEVESAVSQ